MHVKLGREPDGQPASKVHWLFTVLAKLSKGKAYPGATRAELEYHAVSLGVSSLRYACNQVWTGRGSDAMIALH